MGSATESNAKPQIPMAERTLKKIKGFFKKDKKKEKHNEAVEAEIVLKPSNDAPKSIAAQTVENLFQKLNLKDDIDDELSSFSIKTVKDECRNDRSDSHSSEDSGFAEKLDEETGSDGEDKEKDEVIVALENLSLEKEKDDDKCHKEKRVQTVVVSRAPIRNKLPDYKSAPYYVQQTEPCRQIQVNKNTLTGGQVIVNDFLAVDAALKQVQQTSHYLQSENKDEWFSIISEVIQEDQNKSPECQTNADIQHKNAESTVEDILSDFIQSQQIQQDFYQTPVEENVVQDPGTVMLTPPHQDQSQMGFQTQTDTNPIEEFSNNLNYELFGDLDLTLNSLVELPPYKSPSQNFMFPTPPHSENAASPMSDSQGSFRTSDYTYSPGPSVILSSPERSSPICHSDYEKFQEIPSHYEESTVSPVSQDDERKRERNNSTSLMTMKQYKDLQKEISHSFSKKDCCQLSRRSCKQLFEGHWAKLSAEKRGDLCLNVAKMNLENAYGALKTILRKLSQSSEQEDLHYALFYQVCNRVLAQAPAWYVDDFGLNVLKSAALLCPNHPLLTRYVVQCVRAAIKIDPSLLQGRDSVFHEVDAQGDTLVTAMARRGDSCADALSEIVRRDHGEMLLFKIHHINSDGASALHVACSEHSASSPRLHIAHVLLEHGDADLWQGDAKAGDTPVHMAVNSRNCDLHLVMVLFKHVDRKTWKKLAHAPNMCSTTPLEYARSATKSQVRDGYPTEVLEFLKKCR